MPDLPERTETETAPEGSPHSPGDGVPQRMSRATAISLTLIVASGWYAFTRGSVYWSDRRAGSSRRYYRPGLELARLELELRTVAVRRYAARTGHLPEALADCADDGASLVDLAFVLGDDSESRRWRHLIDEPWWWVFRYDSVPAPDERPPYLTEEIPPISLDLFGLPIAYSPKANAKETPQAGEVHSSDRLSPEIEVYASQTGGMPPPPPEPFAVSSLFVAHRESEQRSLDANAAVWRIVYFGGLAGILAAGIVGWRRSAGDSMTWEGRMGVGASALLASVVAAMGLIVTTATCYEPAEFRASSLTKQDRLSLLDDAVGRGQVSSETAELARRHIEQRW